MPIYAYRCAGCGHAQDVLQKMSDAVLSVCPACGAARFEKQLTAAGFQLKGSGWYVTDFRGGNTGAKKEGEAKEGKEGKEGGAEKAEAKPADKAGETAAASATAKADTKPAAAPAAAAPTPAAPSPSSNT